MMDGCLGAKLTRCQQWRTTAANIVSFIFLGPRITSDYLTQKRMVMMLISNAAPGGRGVKRKGSGS